MIEHGTVYCDGMPGMYGCPAEITVKRRWTVEGKKRNGWLVTHSVDDIWGTPSVPRYLLHFCPSCAVIVLSQMAEPEQRS